jgi:hypothetical protein
MDGFLDVLCEDGLTREEERALFMISEIRHLQKKHGEDWVKFQLPYPAEEDERTFRRGLSEFDGEEDDDFN